MRHERIGRVLFKRLHEMMVMIMMSATRTFAEYGHCAACDLAALLVFTNEPDRAPGLRSRVSFEVSLTRGAAPVGGSQLTRDLQ
jgi:hypothetical protein